MTAELWVIEAPGKARILERILAEMGRDARVQATRGHLLAMPSSLTPTGVDKHFNEYLRAPKDLDVLQRLRTEAAQASDLIIATDADAEGDVIASDVKEACADLHPYPKRVKMRGMDAESVLAAIDEMVPFDEKDAIPGRTRAIIDRLIGSAFSGNGVAVGRVGTAILGILSSRPHSPLRLHLEAPAADSGRPFVANCPVVPPLTRAIAERLVNLRLPALPVGQAFSQTHPPSHTGDILLKASEVLDQSPKEISDAMQRVYEAGKLSYPRSGSRALSPSAINKVKEMVRKAGFAFDADAVSVKGDPKKDIHDAPYPIGAVALGNDPRKLGIDEGVRTLIARDLVRMGQVHQVEIGLVKILYKFLLDEGFGPDVAEFIAGLEWRRENGPRYPGQRSWTGSSMEERRPDAVVLASVLDAKLGRPSTWANHVENFMQRGLVDEMLQLTEKGREWLVHSPPALLNPALSIAIERACEEFDLKDLNIPGREPFEVLAERIIQVLPPEIRDQVLALVSDVEPQPRLGALAHLSPDEALHQPERDLPPSPNLDQAVA